MVNDIPAATRIRPTVRIAVIDPDNRVLMLHLHYPSVIDPANPTGAGGGEPFWALPGGGVQPGETDEEAACRELWEETGIAADAVDGWLWTREKLLHVRGADVIFQERYGLVRLAHQVTVSFEFLVGDEQEALVEARWFTVEDLAQQEDPVSPLGLAELLQPVVQGIVPSEPLALHR